MSGASLENRVGTALNETRVLDLHTHLFAPGFDTASGGPPARFLLSGIDELLTYHYLQAEFFRVRPETDPARFLALPTRDQADAIWRALFLGRTPMSEACRGVITTLASLGLEPDATSLDGYRSWFAGRDRSAHVDHVMSVSGVDRIVMTNEVFDPVEHGLWMQNPGALRDPRFAAVLRVDTLLSDPAGACDALNAWGYAVEAGLGTESIGEIRRFLREWIARTGAVYVAASLPPEFSYGTDTDAIGWRSRVIGEALLPELAEHGLAWAMMIGSRRGVNPRLGQAGDSLGPADIPSVERLCAAFPSNRFLVTVLSRESQHALAVAARKFANLTPFGCWWFVNTPSLISEITTMRLELLGTSFIPQHSDARVLEQLIYKWDHSRRCIAGALAAQYEWLESAGLRVTDGMIRADAERLLRGNTTAAIKRDGAADRAGVHK